MTDDVAALNAALDAYHQPRDPDAELYIANKCAEAAQAMERERCARIADEMIRGELRKGEQRGADIATRIAAAIRSGEEP